MLGFKFIKFQPTDYILQFKNGKIVKEGSGLSFIYYAPTTSLVLIPISSSEAPFIFEEASSDYQMVTIQGQVTYKIADPKKIADILNYTLDGNSKAYVSEDPFNLSQRIINAVQVLTKKYIQNMTLRESLRSSEKLVESVSVDLKNHNEINSLGLEILSLSILAIKPNAETARALEAEAREQILKEADDAIYERRNSSVEQERKIKENELNTEIAIENKKRQIRETQMEAEKSVQEKRHELKRSEMNFSIGHEEEKKKLVELTVQNAREEADASAYAIGANMKAFQGIDPNIVKALANSGMNPQALIAQAFQGLSEKAEKIGQLNISPELLQELLKRNQE